MKTKQNIPNKDKEQELAEAKIKEWSSQDDFDEIEPETEDHDQDCDEPFEQALPL